MSFVFNLGTDPESKRLLQHIFEDYEDEQTGAMARYAHFDLHYYHCRCFINNYPLIR